MPWYIRTPFAYFGPRKRKRSDVEIGLPYKVYNAFVDGYGTYAPIVTLQGGHTLGGSAPVWTRESVGNFRITHPAFPAEREKISIVFGNSDVALIDAGSNSEGILYVTVMDDAGELADILYANIEIRVYP